MDKVSHARYNLYKYSSFFDSAKSMGTTLLNKGKSLLPHAAKYGKVAGSVAGQTLGLGATVYGGFKLRGHLRKKKMEAQQQPHNLPWQTGYNQPGVKSSAPVPAPYGWMAGVARRQGRAGAAMSVGIPTAAVGYPMWRRATADLRRKRTFTNGNFYSPRFRGFKDAAPPPPAH